MLIKLTVRLLFWGLIILIANDPDYNEEDFQLSEPWSIKSAGEALGEISQNNKKIVSFFDQKPVWSDAKQKYVYYFNGRCQKASVKNTILVSPNHIIYPEMGSVGEKHSVYQFGRWDKDVFNLDFYYPMSILTAFGLAIAIFDTR